MIKKKLKLINIINIKKYFLFYNLINFIKNYINF